MESCGKVHQGRTLKDDGYGTPSTGRGSEPVDWGGRVDRRNDGSHGGCVTMVVIKVVVFLGRYSES